VEQGRGAFLAEHAIDYAVGPRTRFSENLLRQGRQPAADFLRAAETPASKRAARALEVKIGAPLILLEGLSYVDNRPVSLGQHYLPARRVPGIAEIYKTTRSITKALAQLGIADYRRRNTRVISRMPEPDEARLLRMPPARPLLVTESVNVDPQGRPIEYGIARFVADRIQLVIET
jgi:GntR family transcriptional regulator, phosphonate transport system regulatory protein